MLYSFLQRHNQKFIYNVYYVLSERSPFKVDSFIVKHFTHKINQIHSTVK